MTKVTIKDIKARFNTDDVKQIDSKQLFIVTTSDGTFLVSYYTIIGKMIRGAWHVTTKKYSATTSRQSSQFVREHMPAVWINNHWDDYM